MKTLRLLLPVVLYLAAAPVSKSEILQVSSTTVSSPSQVTLSGDAYALWGTGSNTTTFAPLYYDPNELNLISPALQTVTNFSTLTAYGQASLPAFNYLASGSQVYGGLGISGLVNSEGFNVHLTPSQTDTTYTFRVSSGVGGFFFISDPASSYYSQNPMAAYSIYDVTVTARNSLETFVFGVRSSYSGGSSSDGVALGAVTAVVDEPPLAANCLLTGICLTPMLFKWRRRREQPNPSPSRAGQ